MIRMLNAQAPPEQSESTHLRLYAARPSAGSAAFLAATAALHASALTGEAADLHQIRQRGMPSSDPTSVTPRSVQPCKLRAQQSPVTYSVTPPDHACHAMSGAAFAEDAAPPQQSVLPQLPSPPEVVRTLSETIFSGPDLPDPEQVDLQTCSECTQCCTSSCLPYATCCAVKPCRVETCREP